MYKIRLNILLGWALLLPITAYSLGLGEIDVKSFLNQPLKADISIISARPGEIDDLIVGLANRAAFSRASLSRPSHLSELKFKTNKAEDGSAATITVTTKSAVKEPVLNFLVEADWGKGRLFREFTILLDPPYLAQQTRQAPAPKAAAPKTIATPVKNNTRQVAAVKQPEPIVNREPAQPVTSNNDGYANGSAITEEYSFFIPNETEQPTKQTEQSNSASQSASSDSILVTDGATLWSVAKTLKKDGLSMSQVMLALQRVNHDAFGKNNINNLKQGSVLRVPTQQDMAEISQRDAYVEVLKQNGLWGDYLASIGHASVSAGNTQSDQSAKQNSMTGNEPQDSLSIVAVEEGSSDKAALRSDDNKQKVSTLRKQLLLSEEETESLKVERDELSSRVKMLEAELDKRNELQNLVTIEDDSLATMQQELTKKESMNVEMPSETVMPKQEDMMAEEEPLPTSAELTAELDEAPVEMQPEEMAVEAIVEQEIAMAETPVIQTPVIVSEPKSSPNVVDNIIQAVMSNPIVQGAIVGVLLLVLIAVKILKGRKEKSAALVDSGTIEDSLSEDPVDTQTGIIIPSADDLDDDETPINVVKMEEEQPVSDFDSTVAGMAAADDDDDEFSKTAIISADDMSAMEAPAADAVAEEQDETLDEVDVYLAYSLFENAEELLKDKLKDSPDRADYRAKLLDTYFAMQNKDAFIEEAGSLKSLGDAANKYWPRVQTMGFELAPDNSMFADGEGGDLADLTIAKPEMADFDIGAEGEVDDDASDFDLSLDGDDTNFSLSDGQPDNEETGELEFNLDDDLSTDVEVAESKNDDLPDDLDAGLDFDFDEKISEEIAEPEEDVSIESEGDLEFNLDDDLLTADSGDEDKTAVIEIDDLEFNVEDMDSDDDILDISVDDIEPEIDLSSDTLEGEETGTIAVMGDDDDNNLEIDIDNDSQDDLAETIAFNSMSEAKVDEAEESIDEDMLDLDLGGIDESDIDLPLDDAEDVSIQLDDDLDSEIDIEIDGDNLKESVGLEEGLDEAIDLELDAPSEDIEEISSELESELEADLVIEAPDVETEKTEVISVADIDELEMPDIEMPDIDLGVIDDEDITDISNIEGLMLPDDVDEVATKLDLAKAFHDMGDSEGARSSLEEVLIDGSDEQKAEAETLLKEIDG